MVFDAHQNSYGPRSVMSQTGWLIAKSKLLNTALLYHLSDIGVELIVQRLTSQVLLRVSSSNCFGFLSGATQALA